MRSRRPPRARRPQRSGNYYRHYCYCPYYYPNYWDYEYDYDYDWGDDYWEEDYEYYEPYEPYLDVVTEQAYKKGFRQGIAKAKAMMARKEEPGNGVEQ